MCPSAGCAAAAAAATCSRCLQPPPAAPMRSRCLVCLLPQCTHNLAHLPAPPPRPRSVAAAWTRTNGSGCTASSSRSAAPARRRPFTSACVAGRGGACALAWRLHRLRASCSCCPRRARPDSAASGAPGCTLACLQDHWQGEAGRVGMAGCCRPRPLRGSQGALGKQWQGSSGARSTPPSLLANPTLSPCPPPPCRSLRTCAPSAPPSLPRATRCASPASTS